MMKTLNRVVAMAFVGLALQSVGARADTINVLWYTWADPASECRTSGLPKIAADAASNPQSAGNSWVIT